jgi:RNA polymerase sigma-70 factor (ECF subfamily)
VNPDTGDSSEAIGALVERSCERLRSLTRRMLHGQYSALRRWEDTNDVLQQAMLRLLRSLKRLNPQSDREFYQLAARQIRWELIDLCRRHFGPEGIGTNYDTAYGVKRADPSSKYEREPADATSGPDTLLGWAEFHEQVETLPQDEREIFDLLWYQQLSQQNAADVLGVSLRTVKRRWQRAKLHLFRASHGQRPG